MCHHSGAGAPLRGLTVQWQLPVLRGQNTQLCEALQDLRTEGATAVDWAWLAGELAQLHPSACPRLILTMPQTCRWEYFPTERLH